MKKVSKNQKDALGRSIESRERGIDRMRANIRRIQQDTARQIADIEVRIKEKSILLDALKRGRIKK